MGKGEGEDDGIWTEATAADTEERTEEKKEGVGAVEEEGGGTGDSAAEEERGGVGEEDTEGRDGEEGTESPLLALLWEVEGGLEEEVVEVAWW